MKTKEPLNAEQTRKWVDKYNRKSSRTMWGFYIFAHPVVLVIAWIATGELSGELLMTVAFVSVITLILLLYSRARLRQSWYGKVVRKEIVKRSINRGDDQANQIKMVHQLRIQTDRGKKLKHLCIPAFYDYVCEGDEVFKIPGFGAFEKGMVDEQIRSCIACGTIYAVTEGRCSRCKAPIPNHATLVEIAKS